MSSLGKPKKKDMLGDEPSHWSTVRANHGHLFDDHYSRLARCVAKLSRRVGHHIQRRETRSLSAAWKDARRFQALGLDRRCVHAALL